MRHWNKGKKELKQRQKHVWSAFYHCEEAPEAAHKEETAFLAHSFKAWLVHPATWTCDEEVQDQEVKRSHSSHGCLRLKEVEKRLTPRTPSEVMLQ